jgi:predicted dehydrogenase
VKQPLRIGILGGGSNSAVGQAHMASLRMDRKFEIGPSFFSHLEDENRESHLKYGLSWSSHPRGIQTFLNDYAHRLDLVAILTPSTQHLDHIEKVIDSGLPFVCEKPVACSSDQLSALHLLLDRCHDSRNYFVHNYSGYPMFRELVLRVQDGQLGRIHHVRVKMPSDGFARERIIGRPQLWRQSDPEIPMIMLDLGTHMHHLVRMVLKWCPSSVMCRMHEMINSFGVVDNVEIWEQRDDGVAVSYWMSKAHLGIKNGLAIEVYGSEGSLTWEQMNPDVLSQADLDSTVATVDRGSARQLAIAHDRFKAGHPTGFVEAFANFYSDLADDFIGSQTGAMSDASGWIRPIGEAMDGIRFLATAVKASATGTWVRYE